MRACAVVVSTAHAQFVRKLVRELTQPQFSETRKVDVPCGYITCLRNMIHVAYLRVPMRRPSLGIFRVSSCWLHSCIWQASLYRP